MEVVIFIQFLLNINTYVDLVKIQIVSKMDYVAPIEEAGLSSKLKPIKYSRDRNIHMIVTKLIYI